ncbi:MULTISPECIES: RimK family alpha-L-glutamate ligase [unclassified Acinetobacter]|uniref:ATP-grasp domain-containing protein n=1 Tax=unclassified Acinetobacter TaxID=196816 RepID=UPI0015D149D2|nr:MULTISPECIES: hypothetical protein [unclassified Acinetobacter]
MKIAIHHRSGSFSERWINYCEKNAIEFKLVNAFDNNIIEQLADCDAFLWHHHHAQYKDVLTAKRILFALEHAGIKVFPDFRTGWHFDDKVAQKYLLEAINAPLVPSYVFYDKEKALEWANNTDYPKVFKLKGGAGSSNVRLAKNKNEAIRLINKAFGKGFAQFDRYENLKEKFRKFKSGQEGLFGIIKGLIRLFIGTKFGNEQYLERGYIYFQEFIPNNNSDIRVIVVGDKAFAIKRMVRDNDFRASGSGNIVYDHLQIDVNIVELAFHINKKLQCSSVAFDFVIDKDGSPLVVEISYGYAMEAYDKCPGYWDDNLNWHNEKFDAQAWTISQMIEKS